LSSTSAPISIARRLAAVSVVKNGLPVPAAKMTTRPSRGGESRAGECSPRKPRGSDRADKTRATARALEASCIASELITVASMPM
jgi:hypothetical protein